jgi:hypothetical protein
MSCTVTLEVVGSNPADIWLLFYAKSYIYIDFFFQIAIFSKDLFLNFRVSYYKSYIYLCAYFALSEIFTLKNHKYLILKWRFRFKCLKVLYVLHKLENTIFAFHACSV